MNVLIGGASNIIAIVLARVLQMAGHHVVLADTERFSRAFWSRYCTKTYLLTDPCGDSNGFAADLERCITRENISLVVPTRDEVLMHFLEAQTAISGDIMVTFPRDGRKVRSAMDKANLPEVCCAAEVSTPKTVSWEGLSAAEKFGGLRMPVAVKPARGAGGEAFVMVERRDRLLRTLSRVRRRFPDAALLVQEYIPGDVYGAGGVFEGQVLHHAFCYKYVRRYPRQSGPATLCRSEIQPPIRDAMSRVLSALNWEGYCHMDFVMEAHTGQPYLLDINPVHWYSLPFSSSPALNCIVSMIATREKRLPAPHALHEPYATFSPFREFQRIVSGGLLRGGPLQVREEYWRCMMDLRSADFFWDPAPVLLAPVLRAERRVRKLGMRSHPRRWCG